MTLTRYLSRLLAVRIVLVLLALAMLLQLLEMLDNAGTLVGAGVGAGGMLTYALWRLPLMAAQVLPIAVLAGALLTWLGLVRANELVALRAAGVTGWRLLVSVLPVALAASALHFALSDQIAPRTETAFAAWWQTIEEKADVTRGEVPSENGSRRDWMRAGQTLIAVGGIDSDRRRIDAPVFVMLDDANRVERRLDARAAVKVDGNWQLVDVRDVVVGARDATETERETMEWPGTVSAEDVISAADPPVLLSIARLTAILSHAVPASFDAHHYRTVLHHQLALTLAAPLMILLAMPAAFGMTRFGGSGRGFLLGFALGLGYLVMDGMLIAMGRAGVLPSFMAAWTAPIVFACIGVSLLLKLEDP